MATSSVSSPSSTSALAQHIADLTEARANIRRLSLAIARELGLDLAAAPLPQPPLAAERKPLTTKTAGPSTRVAKITRASVTKRPRRWQTIPINLVKKALSQLAAGHSQARVAEDNGLSLSSVYNLNRKAKTARRAAAIAKGRAKAGKRNSGSGGKRPAAKVAALAGGQESVAA